VKFTLKEFIILAILGVITMGNSGCVRDVNGSSHNVESGPTISSTAIKDSSEQNNYCKEDFLELKSGSTYDEVINAYGEPQGDWYNLIYPLDNGQYAHITISIDRKVLFLNILNEDGKPERFMEWEERERNENGGMANTPHKKEDFINLKKGTPFKVVEEEFGMDYVEAPTGVHVIQYLVEDYNWVTISFDNNELVADIKN